MIYIRSPGPPPKNSNPINIIGDTIKYDIIRCNTRLKKRKKINIISYFNINIVVAPGSFPRNFTNDLITMHRGFPLHCIDWSTQLWVPVRYLPRTYCSLLAKPSVGF